MSPSGDGHLRRTVFGVAFQNPVLLAAGTCGFGAEVREVTDLEALGGLVTKSVTLEPRWGDPAPRVAEFGAGMINSVGLANPGAERVRREKLPWLRDRLTRARVLVSVAGHTADEYVRIVDALDGEEGFVGWELNLSCPNDARLEGRPFALDRDALSQVVSRVRSRTRRPVVAKLAPNDPEIAGTAAAAVEAGADGVTLVNTLPGLVLGPDSGRPILGAGPGGVSGPGLRPVGVRAVEEVARTIRAPVIGVGGISTAADALEYLHAGAALVQVGTASFADPRAAERVVRGLRGRAPALPAPEGGAGPIGSGAETASAGEPGAAP